MFWMFVVALWVAMLLSPIALLIAFLPAGRDCPRCASETVPIRTGWLRPMRRFLQQRWCLSCGWEGVMRYTVGPRPVPVPEPLTGMQREADDDAAWRGKEV